MMLTILQLGLSLSVLTNCYTVFRLIKALKENDNLDFRLTLVEHNQIKSACSEEIQKIIKDVRQFQDR